MAPVKQSPPKKPSINQRAVDEAVIHLANHVRSLRKDQGLKLDDLAVRSGLSVSTLSKIENRQISPTFDTLIALAEGLGIGISALVSASNPAAFGGRRCINRNGQGVRHETPVYDYTFLSTEIRNKKFIPIVADIKAGTLEAFSDLSSHSGEEFFYVLSGCVTLHTDLYEPTQLQTGDCIYFDSAMGHALVAAQADTKVLWISSWTDEDALRGATA